MAVAVAVGAEIGRKNCLLRLRHRPSYLNYHSGIVTNLVISIHGVRLTKMMEKTTKKEAKEEREKEVTSYSRKQS